MTKAFISIAAFFCTAATACKELDVEPERILVDMRITATQTNKGPITGAYLFSKVSLEGPDACTKFSKFDVYQKETRRYEIRGKAEYPAPVTNPVCAQVIVRLDTTLRITLQSKGQHILEFYNQSTLLKRDTVQVN